MRGYDYDAFERGRPESGRLPRRRPMGMDPNYGAESYRGQRYEGGEWEAPYGRYRREHGREAGAFGGSRGRYTGAGLVRRAPSTPPSGPLGPPRPWSRGPDDPRFGYDREFGRGRAGPYGSRPPYDAGYGGRGRATRPPARYPEEYRRTRGGSSEGYLRSGF